MRRVVLDTDFLALAANRLAQILQLVGDDFVDRLTGVIDIIANLLRHIVDRNPVNQLFAFLARRSPATFGVWCRPPRTFRCVPASPSRSGESSHSAHSRAAAGHLENRTNRPPSRRTAAEEQGDTRSYYRADDRRGKEIELLLTSLVLIQFVI
jgi:hypothetical protein